MVERWTGGVKIIFRGDQAWVQVVGSAGGRADVILDGLRALLTVSVRDFLLSCREDGGWGVGTYVARCITNHSIYDCDVFRSFFHLYNPYEPSESEKNFIRNISPSGTGSID